MKQPITSSEATPQERLDANALRVRLDHLEALTGQLVVKMLTAAMAQMESDVPPSGQISEWARAIEASCCAIKTLREELWHAQQ